MTTRRVGYLIGSIATASINRKLANALTRLPPTQLEMSEIPFRDLPFYSHDYDPDVPPVARQFKQAISDADAVLFVTPEYNRSIPAGLKNAIHRASRPYGQNSFARRRRPRPLRCWRHGCPFGFYVHQSNSRRRSRVPYAP